MRTRRRALAALLAAGCGHPAPPATAPPPVATAHRAPVVVSIVVDQMGAWIANERWPLLPETGGFARLRREGTWLADVRYAHAITDTGPGHAGLYTGVPPREHGLWNNDVIDLDAAPGTKRPIIADPAVHTVTADGPVPEGGGSSPAILRVPPLADRLRAERPDALIVSISLKDRGALFAGGSRPDASIWWNPTLDQFVTSTAVATALPAWAVPLARKEALAARRLEPWTPADPAWLARVVGATPDAGPDEGDIGGFGTTFPHVFTRSTDPARAFRSSPRGDEAILDLARAALAALVPGAPGSPTTRPILLALSMSSNDYVGHVFTPVSWEAWDELYRLDASLARFFGDLDARFGADGWSLVLTADHGIRPTVGRRIVAPELAEAVERAVAPVTRLKRTIAGISDPYVFLSREALALPPERLATVRAAVHKALLATPGVAGVFPADAVAATCPGEEDESPAALICRSMPLGLPPHAYVLLEDGAFFDPDIVIGKGSGHGLPALHDRRVPMLVRAPGRVRAGERDARPTTFRTFRQTVEALLELPGTALPTVFAAP